jgi:methionyl-tRNA formyltransferase
MSDRNPLFAFFGTPHFSAVVLDALEANGMLPALIVTAPDKARGRGLEVSPSPVKQWALERGIDVVTPATLKDEHLIA